MAPTTILALLVNLIVIQGRTEIASEDALRAADNGIHFDVYASAIAKAHYSPWMCNYFQEPGYKCLSCSSALHCYPGNFALLVQCAGRNPYCRNGYCSSKKVERCTAADPYKHTFSDNKEDNFTIHDDDKIKFDNTNMAAEEIATSTNAADTKKEPRLF